MVAITGGRLDLGPWEQIFYGEFDGKKKRVLVKIIGINHNNYIVRFPKFMVRYLFSDYKNEGGSLCL